MGGSVRRFHMSVPIVGQIKHLSHQQELATALTEPNDADLVSSPVVFFLVPRASLQQIGTRLKVGSNLGTYRGFSKKAFGVRPDATTHCADPLAAAVFLLLEDAFSSCVCYSVQEPTSISFSTTATSAAPQSTCHGRMHSQWLPPSPS